MSEINQWKPKADSLDQMMKELEDDDEFEQSLGPRAATTSALTGKRHTLQHLEPEDEASSEDRPLSPIVTFEQAKDSKELENLPQSYLRGSLEHTYELLRKPKSIAETLFPFSKTLSRGVPDPDQALIRKPIQVDKKPAFHDFGAWYAPTSMWKSNHAEDDFVLRKPDLPKHSEAYKKREEYREAVKKFGETLPSLKITKEMDNYYLQQHWRRPQWLERPSEKSD